MKLPGNEIGITDILAYRDCPQRFAWGMRRHTPLPERFQIFPGEKADPPGHTSQANAYGSAIHDALAHVEKTACSDDEAIDRVWKHWQHWLEPEDVQRMRDDLSTYRKRSVLGYRVIAVEQEMRVPLFVYGGEQIFFRFKIDQLLQHMQNPDLYLMRDYKSGRLPKTTQEIHRDVQQWAYNWAVHERFPEVQTLVQLYDQLRYGVTPTQKTPLQRATIKDWLIRQVTAIIEDDRLAPTLNDWCAHCELMMDCRVTHLAPTYWKRRVAALAPEEKVGRKIIVQLTDEPGDYQEYIDILPKASAARKVLKRFEDTVRDDLKLMPEARRLGFGFQVKERKGKTWTPEAKKSAARLMGEAFWHVVTFTISGLEEFYGKRGSDTADATPLGAILDLADEQTTATLVVPAD